MTTTQTEHTGFPSQLRTFTNDGMTLFILYSALNYVNTAMQVSGVPGIDDPLVAKQVEERLEGLDISFAELDNVPTFRDKLIAVVQGVYVRADGCDECMGYHVYVVQIHPNDPDQRTHVLGYVSEDLRFSRVVTYDNDGVEVPAYYRGENK